MSTTPPPPLTIDKPPYLYPSSLSMGYKNFNPNILRPNSKQEKKNALLHIHVHTKLGGGGVGVHVPFQVRVCIMLPFH